MVALAATSCTSIADLACVCNNQAFQAVVSACTHQQCPQEDAETAQFQASECAPYNNGTIASSSNSLTTSATPSSTPTNVSSTSSVSIQSSAGTSSIPSDIANQLEGISNPGYSARAAVIIGSVIGLVVVVMLGFFIAWCWKERQYRDIDMSKENKTHSVSSFDDYPPYGNRGDLVTPWRYPNPPTSSAERLNPSNDDLPRPHPFLALASGSHSSPRTRDERNHIRPFILPPLVRAREGSSSRPDFYSQPAVGIKSKKRGRISLGLPPSYQMSTTDLETRPSSSEL